MEIRHAPLDITPEQRANLETLAACIESNGKGRAHGFHMGHFCNMDDGVAIIHPEVYEMYQKLGTCNTSACALGYGVIAGIAPERDESWEGYGQRCFGIPRYVWSKHLLEDYSLRVMSPAWRFLFSAGWSMTDNTRQGAVRRIRYALARGVPNGGAVHDMLVGLKPLCYR